MNLPNPVHFRVYVDGAPLEIQRALRHERQLDMRRAVLKRRTIFCDRKGKRYLYSSERFISLADESLGVMRVGIKPLDGEATVRVESALDTGVANASRTGRDPVRHYRVIRVETKRDGLGRVIVRTLDRGVKIVHTSRMYPGNVEDRRSSVVHRWEGKVGRGITLTFRKVFRVSKGGDGTLPRPTERFFDSAFEEHAEKWGKRWLEADVRLSGNPEDQRALRFCIFHLLIAGSERYEWSIPAKTLSGEGYGGHIFWDAEIYMLPFFAHTLPRIARNMLMYRYRRLQPAREKARALGYRGALFPWESADTGEEVTPRYLMDRRGKRVRVYTHEREHHIAGDVAYAVGRYYTITGDDDFMLKYGAEMVFEVARFWESRVVFDSETGLFEIKNVIGPNEFQTGVDNNSYTNHLARWCLLYARELRQRLSQEYPREMKRLEKRMGIGDREFERFEEIASRMKFLQREDGLIEQFEGYFGLEDAMVGDVDGKVSLPRPEELEESHTQLTKQADVALLLTLFPEDFSEEVKIKNFEYYERRCTHRSSLSPPVFGLLAARIGRTEKAYRYFRLASNADLEDYYGNTGDGIHGAMIGGVWMLVVNGFMGVHVRGDHMVLDPSLPKAWRSVRLGLRWKGNHLKLWVSKKYTRVFNSGPRRVQVEVWGTVKTVPPGHTVRVVNPSKS